METILIATDFSAAAENATRYGFDLAKIMRAQVILLNCCNHFTAYANSNYLAGSGMDHKTEKRLSEAIEKYNGSGAVQSKTLTRQGIVADSIVRAALENEASFIIVGMKENGKEVRKLCGNTVTSLISQSTIPIVAVPEKATSSVPQKVVLASNIFNESSIDVVRPLKRMVETSGSELYIVQVIDKYSEDPVELLMRCSKPNWFLKSTNPIYEFLWEDDAQKAVSDFIKRRSIDMLAIISPRQTFLSKIFSGSTREYFSFHIKIPVLILPSRSTNKTKNGKETVDFCTGKCLTNNDGIPQCDKYRRMEYEYEQETNK